jgi:Tol biopolymer transport system component
MKSLLLLTLICGAVAAAMLQAAPVGVFDAGGDIGVTPKAGKADFDAASGEYRITGGGANVWATVDAFQFIWKRVSGDVTLSADVQFAGAGAAMHRKAMLMIRQGLEPDSAYADVALHGDGLTSLQYRLQPGGITAEARSELKGPTHIRIERRGDQMTLFAGKPGEKLEPTGPITVALKDPVYVGLAVCSHNADNLETAIFSNVKLAAQPVGAGAANRNPSKISVYNLRTNAVDVIYSTSEHFEAPNWSPDGKYLLVNSRGGLWKLSLGQKPAPVPVRVDLGALSGCNNDHGISPDGSKFAISAAAPKQKSQVYVSASDGAQVRLMTPKSPSYFHGWSPDGRWLAFVGQRDENFDLYRVPVGGGEEQRLTSSAGYDDGPDYSPDGKWIYFNSDRSGSWDIWRIPAAGAGRDDKRAQRMTNDEYEDWFPHPSPDGKWLVFLSFNKGTKGHPGGQDVMLRMMPMPGAKLKPADIRVLTKLYGGQGTMNVNSWAPDSRQFAFVSYERLP